MRPVLTQETVRQAIGSGLSELPLQPGTIVTSLARELAQAHNIKLVKTNDAPPPVPAASSADLPPVNPRAAVRSAVIASLGHTPPELDAVLDKVFKDL